MTLTLLYDCLISFALGILVAYAVQRHVQHRKFLKVERAMRGTWTPPKPPPPMPRPR